MQTSSYLINLKAYVTKNFLEYNTPYLPPSLLKKLCSKSILFTQILILFSFMTIFSLLSKIRI